MQTITTKRHPCTNTKQTRFSAALSSGPRVYLAYDYEHDHAWHHQKAVIALLVSLPTFTGPTGEKWIPGGNKDGSYTWVCTTPGLGDFPQAVEV